MSDRYYIYCKHEKEVLVPFAYMDYDGFVTVKGEFFELRDLPKWIIEDEEVVIKTFKRQLRLHRPSYRGTLEE